MGEGMLNAARQSARALEPGLVSRGVTRIQSRQIHTPLIRFTHGRGNKAALAEETHNSDTVSAAPTFSAASMAQLRPVSVPARFRSPPMTEEEIECIELGGARD